MTAQEFKTAQVALGLTNETMADMLCCSLRLVEKMRQGERAISARTEKLLERYIEKTPAERESPPNSRQGNTGEVPVFSAAGQLLEATLI